MNIALLNLPFDSNYGGNLQRYALVTVLQQRGHHVSHIYLVNEYRLPWWKMPFSYSKRLIKKILLKQDVLIFEEQYRMRCNAEKYKNSLRFYEQYIPHTEKIISSKQLKEQCTKWDFDVYMVGSDQVWRKRMAHYWGLRNYFLEFVPKNVKRIAYAVSLGTDDERFAEKEKRHFGELYSKFQAVSVREYSALDLFKQNGWLKPVPQWTLDPTLLLTVDDYIYLMDKAGIVRDLSMEFIFCYVLDMNDTVQKYIDRKTHEFGLSSIVVGLSDTSTVSIEQWLTYISTASLIITDSYHGVVFSILFNRPFVFIGNSFRGNARVNSLFKMLNIKDVDTTNLNWQKVNERIEQWKEGSFSFLDNVLK
ncbi:polysaccharide pyruvyl transferase family protein [Phocaeicola sp.]